MAPPLSGAQFGGQGELFNSSSYRRLGPETHAEAGSPPAPVSKRKVKGQVDTSFDPARSEGHGSGREVPQPPLEGMPGSVRAIKQMVLYPDNTVHALFHDRKTGYSANSGGDWYASADHRQQGKTALQARPGFHGGLGMHEISHISTDSTSRNTDSKKTVLVATEHYGNNHFANRNDQHGEWVTSMHMRTHGLIDPSDHASANDWLKNGVKPTGTVEPPPGNKRGK